MSAVHVACSHGLPCAAATAPYLRLKMTGGTWAIAGATDESQAVAEHRTFNAGDQLTGLLHGGGRVKRMIGASAIAVDANVWGAANGKVNDTYTAGAEYLGKAGTACVADGCIFEVVESPRPQAAGIGYVTGQGGAVTQTTNRSTGVTVDALSGAITTDATSLAAGAEATFTVTNSMVAIGDVVVVSARSGQTAGTSVPNVVAVAAGSFNIQLTNLHAATADTGAMIINFAVIKAVSA